MDVGKDIVDKVLDTHISEWIQKVSKVRPELGNFSLCPFASTSKYAIIECQAEDIMPISGYDVIFYVIEDYFDLQSLQFWVKYYNEVYSDLIFFEDCPENETYISGIPTSNGKYNIIVMQDREKLRKARKKLAETGYYHHWNDELLKEILGEDVKFLDK